MMQRDRKREGLRVCRAAWLVGVSVREYREIEAGDRGPSLGTYERISLVVRRERCDSVQCERPDQRVWADALEGAHSVEEPHPVEDSDTADRAPP
jgi:predicted transcriptional regulator